MNGTQYYCASQGFKNRRGPGYRHPAVRRLPVVTAVTAQNRDKFTNRNLNSKIRANRALARLPRGLTR
jgi:hypothetical protein